MENRQKYVTIRQMRVVRIVSTGLEIATDRINKGFSAFHHILESLATEHFSLIQHDKRNISRKGREFLRKN